MNKRIISLLILASATIAVAQVPTYELDRILPAPGSTSVDLSPDGNKIYISVTYQAVTNQGYEAYDADTYDFLRYYHVPSSAPWVGLVSSDSAYLWTTTYYGGYVKKIDLQSGGVAKSIDLGHWTAGMAFDSQRRYLYVGENVPGGWAIGSLQVVDTLTESVMGSVTLNGEPGFSIILDSTDSYVYLVTRNPGSETLYKIATSDYSFTTLALPGIGSHAGISLSPDGGTAYVKGMFDDIVHLIDTDTITEFDTFSIVDALGFYVSPDGTHALTMNRTGDVDIRIFDFATESIIQTIDLGPIGTMSSTSTPYWDLARGKVYVPTWFGGGVPVLVAQLPCTPVSIDSLTAYPLVVPLGNAVNFEATIVDGCGEIDALWDFDDETVDSQTNVTSPVTTTKTYDSAGVYTVVLTVSDDKVDVGDKIVVVVYDPTGGFVTGGGWIDSPTGAYIANPNLAGKANFGFVSKYKKGANVPTGNTEFVFQAADLNFHSSSYQWLVVNQGDSRAQIKGSGTINGTGDYKFMLRAGDGEPDTFWIQIWEEIGGVEVLYYDNGVDQSIGGGSIIVHTDKGQKG